MASTMTWQIVERGSHQHVLLKGGITEESDFQSLIDVAPMPLMIDLGAIEQINLCGVREWINFVRAIDKRNSGLELLNCSPAIVRQLNMISNFKGNGVVRSVLAPYYCDHCEQDALKPIALESMHKPAEIDETLPCPSCGETMAFDDIPNAYLEFATQ